MLKIFLLTIISYCYCNIWDNLFSQLRSPQYLIPEDFILDISDSNGKLMRILCSSQLNWIKASHLLENTSILDIYLDFDDGMIYIDFPDNCTYTITTIDNFSVKFLLRSYDLITFFRNRDDISKYEYVVTDLFKQTDKMSFLYQEGKDMYINNIDKIFRNIANMINEKLDEDAYAIFRVDKNTQELENIEVKFKGVEYKDLKINAKVEKLKKANFTISHNCSYFNGTI